PLNLTPMLPRKLVPVIVTLVPAGPLVGLKLAIVGAGAVTVRSITVASAVVAPILGATVRWCVPSGVVSVVAIVSVVVSPAAGLLPSVAVAPLGSRATVMVASPVTLERRMCNVVATAWLARTVRLGELAVSDTA